MCWISIIIPVYNGEKTLANALDSAITQPLFSCSEVIIVNDGSTDSTEKVCVTYCERYSNIHVYTQENRGVSAARNRGIALAKGQYLMFLDADDVYVCNALNNGLISILEENNDLILFSGYKANLTRNRYDVYMRCGDSRLKGGRVFPMPESFQAIMYRREMLLANDIQFEENIRLNEDQVFAVESLYAADTIRTLRSFLYIYCKNNQSVCATASIEKYYDMVVAWEKAYDWFEEHANGNKQQMLQYVQWKINSRTLLYAKHYAQGWHWAKGLKKELDKRKAFELLLNLKPDQVMPYQKEDLQLLQTNMFSFILRAKIEGLKMFLGRMALKIPAVRNWRDRKVYPYTVAEIDGPVMR